MADADINKFIGDDAPRDPQEGHLLDLEPWSEDEAQKRASEQGIELTDAHWDVVHYLRERFREHGRAKSGRFLLEELEDRYADQGGGRYLYGLFPNGPVHQGSMIAGVPEPPYTTDPSFGSHE